VSSLILPAFLLVTSVAANADETSLHLAEGAGLTQVQATCSMCHSLDYILMNSPFQDKAGWEKTVNKMVKVMGAPLAADDITAVVAYLDSHYGKESAPSSPSSP
jgi:mono/diheme cytochrome c family protein